MLHRGAFPDPRLPVHPDPADIGRWVLQGRAVLPAEPLYLRRPDAAVPGVRKRVPDMSAEVTVRRLRWWDLQRVLPLEREVFPRDPWSAELFWSELGQGASRHYVVAEPAGARPEPCPVLAGYAGLLAAGGDADVQTLAVAPAFRGRGVGTLLLGELLAVASRRGCPRCCWRLARTTPRRWRSTPATTSCGCPCGAATTPTVPTRWSCAAVSPAPATAPS